MSKEKYIKGQKDAATKKGYNDGTNIGTNILDWISGPTQKELSERKAYRDGYTNGEKQRK